jgi:CheY-like chemotaxis protein
MKKYKSVLLVDDSEMDRLIGKAILECSQITDHVILCKNGLDGLNKLKEYYHKNNSLPELILVDMQMPMMNGLELIGEVTSYPAYSKEDCRIIVLTASFDEMQDEKIKAVGVNNILIKPLDKNELSQILLRTERKTIEC